ncbi:hypothetical protein CXT96_00355 [Akkermansia muciniphila]|jgi:hypothetical protein|nr:hypothetical protein CXT92_07130 [Akkermansia muciniphila]PNC90859.1 hypothetical protein CXT91_08440 [Akkermansia muciniphila]PND15452.1 hypothetical protein CXT96_00355 [Akkermansia muciniphila]QHV54160.1 hypothetical protein DMI71_10120 [Akkermansia muciniphila]QHV56535.1 hypothetical protein DMI72_10270 [Akkermansia muciniphila]
MPSGSWGEAGRADFPAASKLFQAFHLSGMKGRQRVISIHARLVGRYWLFVHAAGESSDAFPEGDFPVFPFEQRMCRFPVPASSVRMKIECG